MAAHGRRERNPWPSMGAARETHGRLWPPYAESEAVDGMTITFRRPERSASPAGRITGAGGLHSSDVAAPADPPTRGRIAA